MPDHRPTPSDDDNTIRRALLQTLLVVHPAPLTVDEARDRLGDERDAVDRAIRDLAGLGIVHRFDRFVLVTQAAVHTAQLLDS